MRRHFIWVFGLLMALGLALPALSSAQGGIPATVFADTLNVRNAPGTANAEIGQLTAGTAVTIIGREDVQGNGGVWVLVSGNGITGWVMSDYLRDFDISAVPIIAPDPVNGSPAPANAGANNAGGNNAPAAPSGDGLSGIVRFNSNVRGGPGTNYQRVGAANQGAPAVLSGRNALGDWYYGTLGNYRGWILGSLVNVNGNTNSLPVVGDNSPVGNVGATPAPAAQQQNNPAPANAAAPPPPVAGGGSLGAFSYGAHIAGFNNPEAMYRAGMTWVKIQTRFRPGDDPNAKAGEIATAHGQGFRILLGVVGYPEDVRGGEAYYNQYAGYVAGLARLGADAIEVWNEPNLDREWANGLIDARAYTRLLALSYNAIKGANPNTIVISGAPSPTGFFGGCQAAGCDDLPYIQGMAAAGAAAYMDCMGAHYNEGIISPRQSSGDPRGSFYTRYYTGMVNTYYNVMRKPICFTELGYVTGEGYGILPPFFAWGADTSVAEQALWLQESIRMGRADSRVRLIIIWNLNFRSDPSASDPSGGYAIIRPDGSCPACDTIGR